MNNDFQQSTWKNESDKVVKLRLLTDARDGKKQQGFKFKHVVIPPGETVELPCEFDRAIRDVRDGVIVGGQCPWLTKVNDVEFPMHPSLDYKAVAEELELQSLAEKIRKEKALEEAIKVQAERKAEEVVSPKKKAK